MSNMDPFFITEEPQYDEDGNEVGQWGVATQEVKTVTETQVGENVYETVTETITRPHDKEESELAPGFIVILVVVIAVLLVTITGCCLWQRFRKAQDKVIVTIKNGKPVQAGASPESSDAPGANVDTKIM